MKGHMQDGKFHPHIEYKGVRKSRDQQVKTIGVRMARGDNNAEILKNRLITFNNFHKPEVEYGTFGGGMGKALIIKDTQTPLSPNGITKSEAIDYLSAIDDYIDNLKETVDGTNEKILTLQPTGKKVTITGSGDVIRKRRERHEETFYDGFWTGLNAEKRTRLLGLYEPKWKSHASRDFKDLNPQEKGWVTEQADEAFVKPDRGQWN